jgi:superfamily II DNA or RNA helicase
VSLFSSCMATTHLQMQDAERRQQDLSALKAYFMKHDRGIVHLACGYGKTFLALALVKTTPLFQKTLVLVPNLALLEQWSQRIVSELPKITLYLIASKITKVPSAEKVVYFENTLSQDIVFTQENYIVVCMYQSCVKLFNHMFDIIIFDEAHHTSTQRGTQSAFSFCLHDANVMSSKRLFMTATLKYLDDTPNPKKTRLDLASALASDQGKLFPFHSNEAILIFFFRNRTFAGHEKQGLIRKHCVEKVT